MLPGASLTAGSPPVLLQTMAVAVAAAAACLAFAYGINSVTDRDGDLDPVKNPLAGRDAPAGLPGLLVGLALAAVLLGAVVSIASAAWAAASILAGWCYSAGPRLKARPIIGTLVNAAIFFPLLGLASKGWALPGGFSILCTTFFVLILQNQVLHEAADRAEDLGSEVRTTGGLAGDHGARWLVVAVGVVSSLAFISFPGGRLRLAAAAAILVVTAGVQIRMSVRRARVVHRHLSLATGTLLYGLVLWTRFAG